MIKNKHIGLFTVVILFLVSLLLIVASNAANTLSKTPKYASKLFGDEIATIDIKVEESAWQKLLENPLEKEYVSGDVVINGEQISAVGLRTKGNSSLTQVASSESDRYSLVINFDYYVKGQTYYELDSVAINNVVADATYMKDYISYEIMDYIGVATPLKNFAKITVNGEDYGFCLLLERYEESFLSRTYNTLAGQLYNVKTVMGGQGNQQEDVGNVPPDDVANTQQGEEVAQDTLPAIGEGMGGSSLGRNSGGGSLLYTDSEIDSYASIFENPVFNKVSDREKKLVITAIENLNKGTDLEKYFDVDEILRYFAAHTVLVNLDSYSSEMQQNYYIYEKDGKISILPWDYNLAFGGFQNSIANDVVNFPIDTPVSGVEMEDRPLLNKLLEVDEYKEKYHQYLTEIVEGYFESGQFEQTINALDGEIGSYVQGDSTSFYTYEQYKNSLPILIELGMLRAESITGQLEGTIPSTTEGQELDSTQLIEASHIALSDLGTLGGGGGDGEQRGAMPDRELMEQAMEIIGESSETITDEIRAELEVLGITEEQLEMLINRGDRKGMGAQQGGETSTITAISSSVTSGVRNEYIILVVGLFLLLTTAILFLAKKKKNY